MYHKEPWLELHTSLCLVPCSLGSVPSVKGSPLSFCLPLNAFLGGLALELPGLPLFKLRRSFPGRNWSSYNPCGRPNLGLGWLQVHGEAGRDTAVTLSFWALSGWSVFLMQAGEDQTDGSPLALTPFQPKGRGPDSHKLP